MRLRRTSCETILMMYTESCYSLLLKEVYKSLAEALDETPGLKLS
jgi:hypothetical protein